MVWFEDGGWAMYEVKGKETAKFKMDWKLINDALSKIGDLRTKLIKVTYETIKQYE